MSLFVVKCEEQQDEWRFVTETKELNKRLDNLKLPGNYEKLSNKCKLVTKGRFSLKNHHAYGTARSYLKLWIAVIEWVNDGVPLSKSVKLDGCSKTEINKLGTMVTDYFKTIFGDQEINCNLRDFFKKSGKKMAKKMANHRQTKTKHMMYWTSYLRNIDRR